MNEAQTIVKTLEKGEKHNGDGFIVKIEPHVQAGE